MMTQEINTQIDKAKRRTKGNGFDQMEVGQLFVHHWGRTLSESDNTWFSSATMHFNPLYLNQEYAKVHNHQGVVLNPYLIFLTVFGMSVEDLSEAGGAFLGVEDLVFHKVVYPGVTLNARSTVIALRESKSRPDSGIATWHTEGFNQDEECIIDFKRTNIIARRVEGE